MRNLGVAIDLGTSGLRGQAIDCQTGRILATVVSTTHPLPGANVMDQLHFALETGVQKAQEIMIHAINRMLNGLPVPGDRIDCLGLCGNPVQLSLLQGMEIRDLAYAGPEKLAAMGVVPPDRSGRVLKKHDIGPLDVGRDCEVIIPPAVHHTVGGDALALILQSGMLAEKRTSLATDYGTNAEMALCHEGRIFTASAAAGPALEGQQITCGMLAAPGALVDLHGCESGYRSIVLDDQLLPIPGIPVDLHQPGESLPTAGRIKGIAGTGAIAVIERAMDAGLVVLPNIVTADRQLHLGQQVVFSEQDLHEAGKAIGAIRAGHLTLCHAAGISSAEIAVAYMAGAAGIYVDALKAQKLGLVPSRVTTVYQLGNTSLKMARELVLDSKALESMNELAERVRGDHHMLAASAVFKKVFMLELSRWTEGMPTPMYRKLLVRYGLADILPEIKPAEVIRLAERDIEDFGQDGLILQEPDWRLHLQPAGCSACLACVQQCPQQALELIAGAVPEVVLSVSRCHGVACRKCERACSERVLFLDEFFKTKAKF